MAHKYMIFLAMQADMFVISGITNGIGIAKYFIAQVKVDNI